MAPDLVIEVSPDPVVEGTSFFINIAASSDPDGEIVRTNVAQMDPGFFQAEQVGSPAPDASSFEFMAPEVFFHERSDPGLGAEIFFDVEIEDDDGSVVTERMTVVVDSVEGTTRAEGVAEFFSLSLSEEVRLFSQNRPTPSFNFVFGVRPVSTDPGGQQQILLMEGVQDAVSNLLSITPEVLPDTIPDFGPFFPGVFSFDLDPGTRQQFAVINELQNKVFWFAAFDPANPKNHELDVEIDVASPCYVEGRTNTGQDTVLVGQRNAGLTVLRLIADRPLGANHEGFDTQIVSTAGMTRSLCFLYPTRLSTTTASNPQLSNLDDVIAIDFDTNELVLLADYAAPDQEYEVVGTLPIDTDGLSGLSIVDALAVGTPGSIPNVIWILMTDGQDMGEHRLVMVSQDPDGTINQKPHPFVGGVPSGMQQLKFFPGNPGQLVDAGADIIVTSSTSSQITIFEDDSIDINPTGNLIPIYRDPIYVDVGGIPASSSVIRLPFVNGANKSVDGVIFSFQGSTELKVFTYMD